MKHCSARIARFAAILFPLALITGCLDLGGDASPVVSPPPPPSSNNAPTISGNPPGTVVVGESYNFIPTASDPDGDPLTFAISNRPSWASFDTATGQLTGVANLGSEGTYSNIQISVSDGSETTSLPVFSVDVVQNALGSATLSWTAPTQNTDGSALTDLTGYRLYYGTNQGSYPNQVTINNPGITTFVVENLAPATYFFVATAVNSAGVESTFSNEASKIVN